MDHAEPAGLGERVAALAHGYLRGRDEVIATRGFTGNEYTLLRRFADRTEWTATELAEALPADASRISRLVNGLVERGLLRRRRRSDDRRVVRLRLSDPGAEAVDELLRIVDAYDARLTDGVSDADMATAIAVIARILANDAASAENAV